MLPDCGTADGPTVSVGRVYVVFDGSLQGEQHARSLAQSAIREFIVNEARGQPRERVTAVVLRVREVCEDDGWQHAVLAENVDSLGRMQFISPLIMAQDSQGHLGRMIVCYEPEPEDPPSDSVGRADRQRRAPN
jgi:riboflavin biosynthesis pyrimidine reductase